MALAGNMQTLVSGGNVLTEQQRTFYEAALIKHLLPFLDFVNEGQKGTIPRSAGGFHSNSIQFRKRNPITLTSAHTTALTEGVPPDFSDVTWDTVTTQLSQYGAALKHSDIIAHAGIDDNVAQFSAALGELAGLVVNTLVVNALAGGGTAQYADGVANRAAVAASNKLETDEFKKAVRTLAGAYVPTFPDGFYHCYIHVRQAFDLQGDSTWITLNGQYYAGQGGLEKGIVAPMGQVHGVKVMKPSVTTPVWDGEGDSGADVYGAFIFGPDSFGVRDFANWRVPRMDQMTGKGIKIHFVPADQSTKDDPLGQFGVMGYKFAFVAKVLDSTRYIRLETGVTA